MVYETFQATMMEELTRRLGEGFSLALQKVPKNNGQIFDGISITRQGRQAAPTVYLNPYYERYLDTGDLDLLVEEILQLYQENSPIAQVDFSALEDRDYVKNLVVCKLIHTASNKELLAQIPSIPYLDLSLVFYLFLEHNEFGQLTALIHNSHMEAWDFTPQTLLDLAMVNTPRLLPPDLRSMGQILSDLCQAHRDGPNYAAFAGSLLDDSALSPLYVLSNRFGFHGACACLYPHVLKNFANLLKKDLVILPSSVHEVLLIPREDDLSFEELSHMVSHINRTEVPPEDRLSDHVYVYFRRLDQIVLVPDSAGSTPLPTASS